MIEEGMRVKFIGDDGNLTKSIEDIEKELVGLKKQLKTTTSGTEFNQLQKQIKSYEASLKQLNGTQSAVSAGVKRSTKDFTGLSRVIQDLPFGFVAISNNLTQILPAAGAAGLAISGLVSIITFASVGFGNWTRGLTGASESAQDHAKKLKEARQALEDYVTSLDDINRIRVTGAQDAQTELGHLKTLYNATQNQNIAIGDRKKLVDELQEQYPKYFGNIKDEIILAGGAKDAYEKLTVAILAASKARAAQKELDQIEEQRRVIDQQQIANLQKQSDLFQKIKDLRSKPVKSAEAKVSDDPAAQAGKLITALVEIGTTVGQSEDAQKQYNKALAEYNKLQKDNISLTDRAINISKELTKTVQDNPEALLDPTGNIKKEEKTKKQFEFLFEFLPFDPNGKLKPEQKSKLIDATNKFSKEFGGILQGIDFNIGARSDDDVIKNAKKFWDDFKKGLIQFKPQQLDVDVNMVPKVPEPGTNAFDLMRRGMEEGINKENQQPIIITPEVQLKLDKITNLEEAQKSLNESVSKLIESSTENLAIGIGQGLGDMISGQGISGMFKNIASVVGDFISSLGQMLIKASVAAIKFKAAFASLLANPVLGIAAGVGLIAIGQVIKNLAVPKARPFAEGGLVFGSTFANIGEGKGTSRSNPEVVAPLDKLKNFIGGTNQPTVFIPALEIGFDKARILFNRANNQGRMFG